MKKAFALATWLSIAGCASAPSVNHPNLEVSVPDTWEIAGTRNVSDGWWMEFGDPALDMVVETALSDNLDLRVAVGRVEAALAQAGIDGAALWPQIQAVGSGSRQKNIFVGLPIPSADGGVITNYFNSYSASLQASWELDLWGRVRNMKGAALAEVQASAADLAGARLSIAAQTTRAWLTVRSARMQLDLARVTLKAFEGTANIAWERYKRGLLSSVDVYLTRNSTASAVALVARREQQLQTAVRQLEVLLGRYPAGILEDGTQLPRLNSPVPGGLPSELVARRPDLAAAERRLAASGSRISIAKANRYPQFSLTSSVGTTSDELSDLTNGNFSVWNLVGNIVQPLFQGGRIRAQIHGAQAQERIALANYAQSVLDAYAQVEIRLGSELTLSREEEALANAASEARSAWDLAEERYQLGVQDLLSVLESQRRSLNADSSLIEARRQRLQNRVDLYVALGGGFESPTNTTSTIDRAPGPTDTKGRP